MLSNSRRSSYCVNSGIKQCFGSNWKFCYLVVSHLSLETTVLKCVTSISWYLEVISQYFHTKEWDEVHIRFYTVLSVDMAFTYSYLTLICEFVNWVQYTNIYKYYFSTNVKSYIKIYIHNNIQTEFLTEIIKCYKNDQVVEQSIQRRGCCWLFLELQENFLIHN